MNQAAQLRRLLDRILPANRFWRRKLGRTAPPLSEIPFTTKAELTADQAAHPPFGTNLTFGLERYTRLSQTSATTGRPLTWLDTPEDWKWMTANWVEVFRAAGVGRGDRVYFAFSFGPFIGFWLAFSAAERLGALCIPGGGLGSVERLAAMARARATVVCCTPTYALRLAEVGRPRARLLVVAGEPGGSVPSVRARISRAWGGARVFDHHGMTEVGPVTYEVPGGLRVMERAHIAEIIDPATGAEVEEGATGELVLTPLGRVGMPLLRYRTGDLVRKAHRRGKLVLAGGILGRTDDMVIVRGVNVFPSALDDVVRRFADVAEYRVKASPTELSVAVEPAPGCRDAPRLAERLASALRVAFSLRIPVRIVRALPRFEMKAKRWTGMRPKTQV